MKIAILGLAQTGKKTLFTLLTGREVPPTRKPEDAVEGIAPIHDKRVDALADLYNPKKTTYAENQFVLCPDITEGSASRQWMDPARRCDLLCILVRAFESPNVFHPAGSVDAERDRARIDAELLLADMALVDTRLQRIDKEKKGGQTPEQKLEEEILHRFNAALEEE
ncbi:MAG: redox-regulated ATPase YchF, partial [Desulfuromonadales bacterium]|nr:redox-regulated ATPase YchF [Desulfuromonadales bacterium]NIS40648.1 redox-regulated ATPase YchF [Desulfuromonadales bacterium]